MAIRDDIEARMRQARKDRDEATRNVIGMLKNKVLMVLKSGSGREDDDALWLEVLAGYAKATRKAVLEFEKAGDRGVDAKKEAEFEIAFCEEFLPTKLDEAATEALIRAKASELGITDPKLMGKLMGALMKDHGDQLDGGLVREVAARVLAEA